MRSAPGAFGASLVARPSKRVFYTLSARESREALCTYARAEPHRSVMEAVRRIDEQRHAEAAGRGNKTA